MKALLRATLVALSLPFAVALAAADEGMWLFNRPPLEFLKERYGFEPGPEWFERVQRASLRVSTGGSASIVSPHGLVFTNHHVAASVLAQLSNAERDLLADGFHARSSADELPCPDLELLSLQSIEDVTARVQAAAEGLDGSGAAEARRQAIGQIESEAAAGDDSFCEVVTLYQGGAYHLYRYRRYSDVRLVFAPEKRIAFFGGDVDNFEYPRFCLDVTFFRIYENGQPLQTEDYLPFSRTGVSAGELVMLAGHPGRTERNYTVEHLEYLRDVQYPQTLHRIWRREVQLANFCSRSEEQRRIGEDDLFGYQNARKLYTGIMAGILDPALTEEKRAFQRTLQAFVWSDEERSAQWGNAWDEIAAAQATAAELYPRYVAVGRAGLSFGSDLANIARDLVRAATERQKPAVERLREYGEANLASLEQRLFSPAPIYPSLEIDRLESALQLMAELLGGDDPLVRLAYAGKSPRDRALELVHGTTLGDVAARRALYDGGAEAIAASRDPLIDFVRSLDPIARELRERWENEVDGPREAGYAKLAAARFAAEGESVYPDATFTLRLATGVVAGYREDGREVAPFTDFDGLYAKHAARGGGAPYELDPRWIESRDRLDGSVPFNFVHTCDSTGGNSGSPTLNRKGEVVGILFDGNIHSLICDLRYTEVQGRSVSVDTRAVIEALEVVYEAGELARELASDPQ